MATVAHRHASRGRAASRWLVGLMIGVAGLVACRAEHESEPTRHDMKRALMTYATCLSKSRVTGRGDVPSDECGDSASAAKHIQVATDWASPHGWAARAKAPGFDGDCVQLVGLPEPNRSVTSTLAKRANYPTDFPYCDGDDPAAGAATWAAYAHRFAEEQLRFIQRKMRLSEKSAPYPPPQESLLTASEPMQYRALGWANTGWAVEATIVGLPDLKCAIWVGAAADSLRVATLGIQTRAAEPGCTQ